MSKQDFTPLHGEPTQPSIEDRWDELRSSIRKTWPQLTKDDLKSIDGDSRKLIALVHQKTGADLHEIEEQIDSLAASSAGLLSRVARSARHAFSSASERISEPFEHAYASTRESVSQAPARSVGIAFGLGLVIGLCTASLIRDATSTPQRRYW